MENTEALTEYTQVTVSIDDVKFLSNTAYRGGGAIFITENVDTNTLLYLNVIITINGGDSPSSNYGGDPSE